MKYLLVFTTLLSVAMGSLLAASEYESCVNDVSSCTEKMLITISLQSAQMNGSESIVTVVNSATSNSSGTYVLKKPLRIHVQKSQVIARYKIVYKQDFNYRPTETVIESDIFSCQDGAYSSSPTCGWQTDSNGNQIANSQGYCCNCEFWEIIGLSSSQNNRALDCGDFNFGEGSANAHCLRYANLWYSAYQIISYDLYYSINVWVYENDSGNQLAYFLLDPSNPIGSDTSLGCIVKLVGDFYPSSNPPDLSSMYLLIPTSPSTNPLVQEGSTAWMLVSASEITFTGLECDKIGVSYTPFQTESSKCLLTVGSCLSNQIYDLYNSDLKRISAGKSPQYLIATYVRVCLQVRRAIST